MAGELATAFVRIRPNLTGFKQEAEAGTATAGSALGKVFALAFGTVVAAELAKNSIQAAASQQAAIARVTQIAKSAGASLQYDGQGIQKTLVEMAEKSGFSVTDLAQAFGRLEQQTKSTSTTVGLLGTASDVARARGQGLAQVATAITRAYAGNAQGLGRLGIILPKYTAQVDALKATHDQATAAGEKFTAQQNLEYKSSLAAATVSDKLVGSQEALAQVQQRFKGQDTIFGSTAAGEVARFHVAIEELEVDFGNKLLPLLSTAATAGREWADELGKSSTAAQFADSTLGTLVTVAKGVGATFEAVAPTIEVAAEAIKSIVGTVGVGPILAAVVAYKLLGKVFIDDAAEITANTAALAANTAAQAANTAATASDATAQVAAIPGWAAGTAAFEAQAVAVEADSAAMVAQRTETGLLSAALGAMGPQLLLLGGAAVVGGLIYLSSLTDSQTAKVNALRDAYKNLHSAQQSTVDAGRAVQAAGLEKSSSIVARQGATSQLDAARAQQKKDLADSHASTAQRAQDALAVAQAEDSWRQANARVLEAERSLTAEQGKATTAAQDRKKALDALVKSQMTLATSDQVAAVAGRSGIQISGGTIGLAATAAAYRKIASDVKDTTAAQRLNLNMTADYISEVGKLPSKKTLTLDLNDTAFYDKLQKAKATLGEAAGALFDALDGKDSRPGPSRGGNATKLVAPDAIASYTTTIAGATSAGISQGLTQASIDTQVAASFKQGVIDAKTSLASLGDGLGSQIGQVLDASLAAAEAKIDASPAARQLKSLTAQIAGLQAQRDARDAAAAVDTTQATLAQLQQEFGPGAHTADQTAQLVAAQNAVLDAQDTAKQGQLQHQADLDTKSLAARKAALEKQNTLEKTYSAKRVADLDDELNKGLISETTYTTQIQALLRKEGVSFKSAGALLGKAFSDGFQQQLASALAQAKIIAGLTPAQLRTGNANAPKIVNPVAVAAKTRTSLDAQRDTALASKTAANTANIVSEIKALGGIVKTSGKSITVSVPPNLSDKAQHNLAKLVKLLK